MRFLSFLLIFASTVTPSDGQSSFPNTVTVTLPLSPLLIFSFFVDNDIDSGSHPSEPVLVQIIYCQSLSIVRAVRSFLLTVHNANLSIRLSPVPRQWQEVTPATTEQLQSPYYLRSIYCPMTYYFVTFTGTVAFNVPALKVTFALPIFFPAVIVNAASPFPSVSTFFGEIFILPLVLAFTF